MKDRRHHQEDRRPLQQNNNISSRSNPSSGVRPKNSIDSTRLSTQGGLRPPPNEHQDLSGASSEADSLLDLYRSPVTSPGLPPTNGVHTNGSHRKRVASQDRSRVRSKASRGTASVAEEVTPEDAESKWIHRDKLAQIESREMAEMGVRLGRPSRAGSRAKSTKTNKSVADGELANDATADADAATRESQRLRQVVDEDTQERRYQKDSDMTSDNAFAKHTPQRSLDRPATGRPGTSRIPVPLSGPASPEDGESHLNSGRDRSDSFNYQKHRTRSRSGSQHLLDAAKIESPSTPSTKTFGPQATSAQSSPPKNRTPSSATEAARKASANRNVSGKTKPRSDSATDSPRPNTSSGRPPTARPEGDAPWIATMYKPDPRLPPEEQMLPTHARRMAELQADSQTRTAQEDSEYTLLEPQESNQSRASPDRSPQENQSAGARPYYPPNSINEGRASFQQDVGQNPLNRASWQRGPPETQEQGQWPLRTPSGHSVYPAHRQQQPVSPTKLESPSTDHGGYNLMPTIQSPQKEQHQHSNRVSHRSVHSLSNMSQKEQELNAAQAPINQPVRLHDYEEKDERSQKKEKGCMKCCVVM